MRKKLPLISGILNVLEKLKGNTGIIENTSVATHTIAAGKYVIWKNDLYKASSAISIGDTLSLSNLTAVSDGIANELSSKIVVVNITSPSTVGAGVLVSNEDFSDYFVLSFSIENTLNLTSVKQILPFADGHGLQVEMANADGGYWLNKPMTIYLHRKQ